MTSTTQFFWTRLEGIGLIITAFGWALFTQLPILFWAIALLYIDLNEYFLAIVGTTLGVSIILASLSCSFTEEWNELIIPDFRRINTASLFYSFLFLIGFFFFFIVEALLIHQFLQETFPPEFNELNPEQRYFSAIAFGLGFAGIVTYIIYKAREIFR